METAIQQPRLRELVAGQINEVRAMKDLPPVEVDDDHVLGEGGFGFDSLDLAILVANLEQATGIDPFANEVPRFHTVGDFVALYTG